MESAVIDRRLLIAASGAALGIAGAVAALVISPSAALISACGALLAASAVLLAPSAPATPAEPAHLPTDSDSSSTASATAATAVAVAETDAAPAQTSELATTSAVSAQQGQAPGRPSNDPPGSKEGIDPGPPTGPVSSAPALTDPETGLFSQDYFDVAIDARIAAARRHLRPVGVVMLEVIEGLRTGRVQPTEPKRVAEAIQETLREADTACRRSDGRFALLLEDTPENGAIWTVERIRRFLAERDPTLTLWAGVACYPAHGFSSETLVELSGKALDTAREWRQDRIEVAIGE